MRAAQPFQGAARRLGWALLPALLLALPLLGAPPSLVAQQLRPLPLPGGPVRQAEPPAPATEYAPQNVRTLLLSLHGFTRAQLDAASTEVPAVLRALIDDGGESVFVRRQAIKALRLYPSDTNFAFVQARLPGAPESFARVYLTGLTAYAKDKPREVTRIVAQALADRDLGVRHAALYLAERLPPSAELRRLAAERLRQEPAEAVRRGLERLRQQQP